MAVPLQGILFLGIIPALIVLFIFLKGYDEYYSDRGVFLTFMAGIFVGFISVIVRIQMPHPSVVFILIQPVIILFIVLFAFFEQLFKTIILNIGRFHEKKATIIYGLSLGLGFGTVFTPFLIIQAASFEGFEGFILTNSHIVLITIGSIGVILFHAATGALIGYGVSKLNMFRYLMIAILLQIPLNALFDLAHFYRMDFFAYVQFGLVLYGAVLFFYVVKKIMPLILIDDTKEKNVQ